MIWCRRTSSLGWWVGVKKREFVLFLTHSENSSKFWCMRYYNYYFFESIYGLRRCNDFFFVELYKRMYFFFLIFFLSFIFKWMWIVLCGDTYQFRWCLTAVFEHRICPGPRSDRESSSPFHGNSLVDCWLFIFNFFFSLSFNPPIRWWWWLCQSIE